MKISGAEILPYSFRLNEPLVTSRQTITLREGFFIRLEGSGGVFAIGDTAPLEGFGSESYQTAVDGFFRFKGPLLSASFSDARDIRDFTSRLSHTPALRCGLEQALLSLLSKHSGSSLFELLGRRQLRANVQTTGLVGMLSTEDSIDRISVLKQNGTGTVKIKIGRPDIKDDLALLRRIRKEFGSGITLRLDVNGKWSLEEAVDNLRLLSEFSPEYIEQPVMDKRDLIKAASASQLPVAADESLRTFSDAEELLDTDISVFILKPMMLGGVFSTLEISDRAHSKGIRTVLSSSLESRTGRELLISLAQMFDDDTAHGILPAPEAESGSQHSTGSKESYDGV